MRKFFIQMKMNLQAHLTYRARVVIWIVSDLSTYAVMPFVWLAIYGSNNDIGGYSRQGIVSYYIIAAFVQAMTASHRGQYISSDIRSGKLTQFLIRPFHYLNVHIFGEASYKSMTLLVASSIFFCVYLLAPQYFPTLPSIANIFLFCVSLVGAFAFSFVLDTVAGLTSFWMGETNAAFNMRWFLEKVFGGGLAPLTFLPAFLQGFALASPFQYLSYFPIQIYLEKISPHEILLGFLHLGLWILGSVFICIFLWKRGLRRYDGGSV